MNRSCIVTVWEKFNTEEGEWEHNHVTPGLEDGKVPSMKHPSFDGQKGWSRGRWRKSFMYIADDDSLVPIIDE